jgi:hypothetical protein
LPEYPEGGKVPEDEFGRKHKEVWLSCEVKTVEELLDSTNE